jgi:hypothetical protein
MGMRGVARVVASLLAMTRMSSAQNRGEAPSPSFASLTRPLPAQRGEVISLLAARTIKRRAAVLHDALDGAAASRRAAFFAFAVVDAEIVLEHAEPAVGELVIAQR